MGRALIIGVGSELRSDDAVGRRVAERVEALALDDVEVVVTTQLVPELVEPIAESERVVFVDASVAADGVEVAVVEPLDGSGGSHHSTPGALLALAAPLGLNRPTALLVEIAAHDLSLGEHLSEETASLVDDAVADVLALIDAYEDGPSGPGGGRR